MVEQQLKKCWGDRLVLGCFLVLGLAASAGCVWKSLEMFGKVWESEKSLRSPAFGLFDFAWSLLVCSFVSAVFQQSFKFLACVFLCVWVFVYF